MPRHSSLLVMLPDVALFVFTSALLILAILAGYRAWRNSRLTPEQRELRRRSELTARGKMGDATLTEVRDDLLFYSYGVRGAIYAASQDVSALREHVPRDLSVALGPVVVKYDPKNPANSIVLSEGWSGLRGRAPAPQIPPAPEAGREE
jgi:hypothetical protein